MNYNNLCRDVNVGVCTLLPKRFRFSRFIIRFITIINVQRLSVYAMLGLLLLQAKTALRAPDPHSFHSQHPNPDPPSGVGAQLCRLSPVDAHTVALKPIHGKITRHYSRYCTVEFCYVHKCELYHIMFWSSGHDVKLHPHRVKLYRIGCVGSGLVLAKALT